jgi:ankyrin repeat protein
MTKGSPVRRFGSQWALPGTIAGATPLMVAALYNEVEIIRTLLQSGANPTLALEDGTTPLLAANGTAVERIARPSDLVRWSLVDGDFVVVPRDESEVVESLRLLLDAGSDVNHTNRLGDTALHAAATAGMTSVIQLLADRGARLEVKNKQGLTPLALTGVVARGRGQQAGAAAEPSPNTKAAGELLRKLGATQ